MDIPEPSDHEMTEDGEDGFLSDPEQLWDQLSQVPFSIIDQTVERLFDRAWDIICKREIERIAEESKTKIPILKLSAVSQLPERTNCLACSEDGQYLGVGHLGGLSVTCTSSLVCVAQWLESELEITSIQITDMASTAYLLGTVDDMGVARVFAYNAESIHLLKVINKTGDINIRSICNSFELSRGGHYGSASISCNGAFCLEVYCFPVEVWLKELQKNPLGVDFRWSPSAVLMRVKPPKKLTVESQDVVCNTLRSVCSSLPESPRHVSGQTPNSGKTYDSSHSDEQDSVFTHRNHSNTDGTKELIRGPSHCTTHFLLPCGSFPGPTKGKRQQVGLPVAVALWWSGSLDLLEYFLCRNTKNLPVFTRSSTSGGWPLTALEEDPKADALWLNAAEIVCSAVSTCTRYIALCLGTALVTVRDRQLGFPLSVISVSEADGVFTSMLFVHCQPAPAEDVRLLQAMTEERVHLLVACKSGVTCVLSTGRGSKPIATQLNERPSDSSGFPAAIISVPFLCNLTLVVQRNGLMFLQDVISMSTVSYLRPPTSQLLASPWEPVYTLDIKKKALLILGESTTGDQHKEQDTSVTEYCKISHLLTFHFGEAAIVEPYIATHGPSELSRQQTEITSDALHEAFSLYLQQRELSLDERIKTRSQTWKELEQQRQQPTEAGLK